jgi:uncharacterized protein YutE (UPF0331/DUF86 family)
MNEIILNKKVSMERCVQQIRRYCESPSDLPFETDYLKQDAIAMNLQRACELSIDIANHLIKTKKLGLPQDSRECFALLHRGGLIDARMAAGLQGMVGFRNILVHEYKNLDLKIIVDIIEHRLQGLLDFAGLALKAAD